MDRRQRRLPTGWYPEGGEEVAQLLGDWGGKDSNGRYGAVVVPHAGWRFSARQAFSVLRGLGPLVETIVICGGHLRPHDPICFYPEESLDTPMGPMPADPEIVELARSLGGVPLADADNTVEVQLPMLRFLFPDAKVAPLRVPPGNPAIDLGRVLADLAGERIVVVASTDLTHYGPNYAFTPHGLGATAVLWAREVNDAGLIERLKNNDAPGLMSYALEHSAACSPGAVAAAIEFAKRTGLNGPKIVEYRTSNDVLPGDSFVGYLAAAYERTGIPAHEREASED